MSANEGFTELITAFQIFLTYGDKRFPIHIENDCMYVLVFPKSVSSKDQETLDRLGFIVCEEIDGFISSRFGNG